MDIYDRISECVSHNSCAHIGQFLLPSSVRFDPILDGGWCVDNIVVVLRVNERGPVE